MWVKWLGAALIVTAAIVWGNQQAAKLRYRVKQLEEFRLALRLLIAEIGYTATPLPRALEHVRNRLRDHQVQMFLLETCDLLGEPDVPDASAAWTMAAGRMKNSMYLLPEDWPVLLRAAAGLGGLGRESQIQQLEAAETQLASHVMAAAARCEQGEKMWRYLGVMGGTALVILLL